MLSVDRCPRTKLFGPLGESFMVVNESTQKSSVKGRYPDKLQQVLNRLYKRYEDLSYEDRRQRVARDIEQMDAPEVDRKELLSRLD